MSTRIVYQDPLPTNVPPRYLVVGSGVDERRYTFFDRIMIGRVDEPARPGVLYVDDETVSQEHCVISQTSCGRCFLRDLSRNGTRLDGRRMHPSIEVEIHAGQVLSVGAGTQFRLEGGATPEPETAGPAGGARGRSTVPQVETRDVTVLVGDIRDYTTLVQAAPPEALQLSVSRLFERLEREVERHGGTVKEHHGDALFAFWEETPVRSHVASACRAALELEAIAGDLGRDRAVWSLDGFPLRMDWALATGPVVIHSFGGDHPMGLSVVGEPVVLAFRIEKVATDATGPIVACPATRREAGADFLFEALGPHDAKGFAAPVEVFALRRSG
ncbi:MAG: adenylate/guanylate cyclase domain-containing protein [Planctomycetota bacterium]|jgi:class 3 adenylate cyclase